MRTGRLPQTGAVRPVVLLGALAVLVGTPPVSAQDVYNANYAARASTSRTRGEGEAPVFVYEFANFQCPHCARFALEVFPRIDSAFVQGGQVRWIFVHLPGPTSPNAWSAHEAAACAGAVGDRFWAMHDRLFRTQKEWGELSEPRAQFAKDARELGIAPDAFDRSVADDRVASVLLQDVIFAASSRVNGTPAYVINNEVTVMGLKSYDEWRDILGKALKRKNRNRERERE